MPHDVNTTCLSCGTVNPLGSRACHVCGTPLETTVFLPAGERVGNFVLQDVLGRGGFGITYRARDATSGEIVALKELFPEGLATRAADDAVQIPSSSLIEWEQLKTRFSYEAQLLQRIKHEASTHFVALFAANDTLYLAMEFVQGETLEARLQNGKRLGMKEARSLLRDVLGVLEEVHALNLLHRDIKPANIILQPTGAELIDFGSGIYFEKSRTMKISQRLLTPAYAPLELYGSNVRLSPAADLYSLAATVYEAVSGLRPPSALERANGATLESLSALRPDIAQSFARAIDAALEVRVDARPQSVAEFRALLELKKTKAPLVTSVPKMSKAPKASKISALPRSKAPTVTASRDNEMFGGAALTLGIVFFVALIATVILDGSEFWQRVMQAVAIGGATGMVLLLGSWLFVEFIRLVFGIFLKLTPMSFYRQSMLGVYCAGLPFLFLSSLGVSSGLWEAFPLVLLFGGAFLFLGLLDSSARAKPRVLRIWQIWGLHIAVPCLILGWFFNPLPLFESLVGTTDSVSPSVSSPTASSPVTQSKALADVAISGYKWACQQQLAKPFEKTVFSGTALIPLDDESRAVAIALEPRLNATALPCMDAASNLQKFTNLDISQRQDRAIRAAISCTSPSVAVLSGSLLGGHEDNSRSRWGLTRLAPGIAESFRSEQNSSKLRA